MVACLILAALAVGVLSPTSSSIAGAQPRPTATIVAIQLPPPVPGLDYSPVDESNAPPVNPILAPATPAAPVDATLGTLDVAAPDSGGSLTASLGGTDSSASSVGGSHEIDGPKRRANKSRP